MEGKFPHPSLDVEVEVRSMGSEEKTEEAMPRGKFKKYLPSGYASGYASGNIFAMPQGKFKKIFALWLCFRLRLRQYFRYASGYASGNFFKIFKKIAQGNTLSYPSGYALGHPRGCLSLNN
ncbi:hypothetical protein T03_9333 [Trichinella britovi]|uniref:Uncharacterized protein n=1 Tax=Trichinella britovi TaxID=45882 RepID=A0A0V1CIW5_TRIBR|nr:hypothetical protein T03_9333 [Trichinella britovi]